jgi:transcriptional regulator with XRE-family HTH domain
MHGVQELVKKICEVPGMDSVVRAVRALRQHFGESQQAFANRLQLSIRAIANYEKDRRPAGTALVSLARAASNAGKQDLTNAFMNALVDDLGLKDIPFRLMSMSNRGGRLEGLIFAHLDDAESIEYASQFWDALEDLKSDFPEIAASARKRLNQLKDPERQLPPWARPREEPK